MISDTFSILDSEGEPGVKALLGFNLRTIAMPL